MKEHVSQYIKEKQTQALLRKKYEEKAERIRRQAVLEGSQEELKRLKERV
jgi:hypothetical protein